jgi:N-acetylglucosaminyldiphosphoundecaprenol N-acetyl-beta-D-mannosaminyltransferase
MSVTIGTERADDSKTRPRVALGPLSVDGSPRDKLIDAILKEAFHASSTRAIATVNAQFYVLAERDVVFQDCLRRSEFVCPDGSSITMAASLFSKIRLEKLAGVDLVQELCSRGAEHGLKVFLLGGRAGSAEKLTKLLTSRYPGLQITGIACPPVGFEKSARDLAEVLHTIQLAKPQIVFVALGAPKQELFIDQYLRKLRVPVAIGVGGSFEILTGITRRAPRLFQQVGMEWLYRLCQEPRRLWRRYVLGNPEFLWIMGRYYLSRSRWAPLP